MDSMVGYRNLRYIKFGRLAARLDDVANYPPARLAVPIIFLSAWLLKFNAKHCLYIAIKHRLRHPSPNAAHAESAVAGALELKLGGPTYYCGYMADKQWIGDGSKEASYRHIHQCCRLIFFSGLITFIGFFSILLIWTY